MKETEKKHINPSYEMLQARYYIDNLESKYANNQNKINLSIIHWKEFEELVAALFTLELECKVTPTRGSNDHGIDAIAIKKTETGFEEIIFQMKRYKGYVGPHVVRDLLGTMVNNKATAGVLVTTGSFGPSIYEFVQNKRIYLYNGPRLLLLLRKHGYSNFYINSKKSYKPITKPKNMNKILPKQTLNNVEQKAELQLKMKKLSKDLKTFQEILDTRSVELNKLKKMIELNNLQKEAELKVAEVKEELTELKKATELAKLKKATELDNKKNENKIIRTEASEKENKLNTSVQIEKVSTEIHSKDFSNKVKSNKNTSKLKKTFIIIDLLIGYIVLSFINIGLGLFYLIIIYLLYIVYKKRLRKK